MKKLYYDNDDVELVVGDYVYSVSVRAEAEYEHIPGRMYMKNGDPGYPAEDCFEVTKVDAIWYDEYGETVTQTSDMQYALMDYLNYLPFEDWISEDYDD